MCKQLPLLKAPWHAQFFGKNYSGTLLPTHVGERGHSRHTDLSRLGSNLQPDVQAASAQCSLDTADFLAETGTLPTHVGERSLASNRIETDLRRVDSNLHLDVQTTASAQCTLTRPIFWQKKLGDTPNSCWWEVPIPSQPTVIATSRKSTTFLETSLQLRSQLKLAVVIHPRLKNNTHAVSIKLVTC